MLMHAAFVEEPMIAQASALTASKQVIKEHKIVPKTAKNAFPGPRRTRPIQGSFFLRKTTAETLIRMNELGATVIGLKGGVTAM